VQRPFLQNKDQIKTKMDFTVKRKLSNGCFKPFERNVDGDANLIKDEIHRSSTTLVFCKEAAVFGVVCFK